MKMKFAITLLLAGTAAFAQEIAVEKLTEQQLPALVYSKQEPISLIKSEKNSFTYIRMGASPLQGVGAVPGMGIGYRLASGSSAVDLSGNFGARRIKHGKEVTTYTLPKVNYLHYFTPTKDNSLYVGGGLAWGGVHTNTHNYDEEYSSRADFHGIIANAAVGYEMQRASSVRSFVQLDVNQPTLAVSQRHEFPSPSAELGVGLGF